MNAYPDLLLFWMSHQGIGSDLSLRNATVSLLHDCDGKQQRQRFHSMRLRFEWLGHIVSGKKLWRVMSPCLLLSYDNIDGTEDMPHAFFSGGRTPNSIQEWKRIISLNGCAFDEESLQLAPTRLSVSGSLENITNVAIALNISLIHNAPFQMLRLASNIADMVQKLNMLPPPSGVIPDIYDMETGVWTPNECKMYDACRCKPLHASASYFVVLPEGQVKTVDAGEAVFLAAHLKQRVLCAYDSITHKFTAPKEFPLKMARALCLCSGRPPKPEFMHSSQRVYSEVPQFVANAVMQQLGQEFSPIDFKLSERHVHYPLVRWFD